MPSHRFVTFIFSGHYIYIETSAPRVAGDKARLISASFTASNSDQCLEFWYHMYGTNVGSLNVYYKQGNLGTPVFQSQGRSACVFSKINRQKTV